MQRLGMTLLAAGLAALLLGGCGSTHDQADPATGLLPVPAGQAVEEAAVPAGSGLPDIAELLREHSAVANQQERAIAGRRFCKLLPNNNAVEDSVGKLAVLSPGDPQPGPAYALYHFRFERSYAEGHSLEPVVHADFTELPAGCQAWFMVANLVTQR
ncbi:hypothetical protein KDL44_09690 [bacterium]|nr:hypothetical protein [bacterium]